MVPGCRGRREQCDEHWLKLLEVYERLGLTKRTQINLILIKLTQGNVWLHRLTVAYASLTLTHGSYLRYTILTEYIVYESFENNVSFLELSKGNRVIKDCRDS